MKLFLLLLLSFTTEKCISVQHQEFNQLDFYYNKRAMRDKNKLVVGGRNVIITSFPYQISLHLNGEHRCGGSILDKNYIITAAHCTDSLQDQLNNFTIRAGSSIINTGGIVVGLSEIIQHENFNANSLDYDIAILKLNSSLTFSDSVQPITLATQMPPALTIGNLTGWGKLSEINSVSYQLQVVELPINFKETCLLRYRTLITERMFCAGNVLGGHGACNGDSGGPFVVNRKLVGIVSFGVGCARPTYLGVYESVPVLEEWIRSKITAES